MSFTKDILESSFGKPVEHCSSIVEMDKEMKQFDDIYFQSYRENNNFISKENLFNMITSDLIEFVKSCELKSEIRVGYILYSKMLLNSNKMNNILNLLIQKNNPNIRVQSLWTIESSYKGPMHTANGVENVDFDKIRLKILVKLNDKDIAIKKLSEMNLNSIKKNIRKATDYLVNI